MKRAFLAVSIAALFVAAWPSVRASAQAEQKASGVVASVDGASVTITSGGQEMKFMVDAKTVVEARGAGTKNAEAAAKGMAGAKLTDVVQVGRAVTVSYTGTGAMMHATRIAAGASADKSAPSMAPAGMAPAAMTATGTVTAVTASMLTINAAGGSREFAIAADTKVVGQGVGTAAAAKGGKASATDLVAKGDRVSVSYTAMGAMMHASEIRVTAKAK